MKTIALLGLVAASAYADEYKQACKSIDTAAGPQYIQNTMVLEMPEGTAAGKFTQTVNIFGAPGCNAGKLGTLTAKGDVTIEAVQIEVDNKIADAGNPIPIRVEWTSKTINPVSDTAAAAFEQTCLPTQYDLTVNQENDIDGGCTQLGIIDDEVCPYFYHVIQITADKEKVYSGAASGFAACLAMNRTTLMDEEPYEHVHDEDDSASALYGSIFAAATGLVASFFALY